MGTISIDNLEKEMRSLVAEILEIDPEKITLDANFVEDLGMDSMMALEILAVSDKAIQKALERHKRSLAEGVRKKNKTIKF